ncbi:MAG: type I-E CRISPR-associated protein Cse1/CasA [Bacillota bacterium]
MSPKGVAGLASFSLLTECWIPARDLEGRLREVSLHEALRHAPSLRRIEDPSPLVEIALHRFLLAVLHRAMDGPPDEETVLDWWDAGSFPEKRLCEYLDKHSDRFDLFHPLRPFYQVADLPDEDPLPWTKLLPERASGHNPTLFDHSVDTDPPPARPAEVARALLVHESFAPRGLIQRLGVTSGKSGPLAACAVFLALGRNLFETLLLNLVQYRGEGDGPLWECAPYHTSDVEGGRAQESLWGRTRVYTWLSRAVRLLPDTDGRVRFIAYGPGLSPREGRFERDPMCAYVKSKSAGLVAVHLPPDGAFWRDFAALLPNEGHVHPRVLEHARFLLMERGRGDAFLLPLAVFGQVTDPGKPAKIVSSRREVYPFPIAAWDQEVAAEIHWAVNLAEETGRRLRDVGLTLAKSLLSSAGRQPERRETSRLVTSFPLLPAYWSGLDVAFPRFLTTIANGDRSSACTVWLGTLGEQVKHAWDHTLRFVGLGSRHLKAIEAGERGVAGIMTGLQRR